MRKQFIDDQAAFSKVCLQLAQAEILVIDTEFVRTRTLYPKLGLIQICDGQSVILIDPLALDDLSPFWQLLAAPEILKILHACSEDLEVFLHHGKCQPVNLLDSQIMMAFLGHGISIGYAAMVKHFLDVELDKSESRTDWTKRPLTEKQLNYAQADVEYLYQLFPQLYAEVEKSAWLPAIKEECQQLIARKFSGVDEDSLYLNVKLATKLNSAQLNRLKYLASWRYQQAIKRDLPLGFVAKDHTLIGLAQVNPKSLGAMTGIEGVEVNDIRHKGKAMLAVLAKANEVAPEFHPKRIQRIDQYPGYKNAFKKLKEHLTLWAEEANIGMENFASKKQMNQFLSWHYQINQVKQTDVDLLQGWRQEIIGERLLLLSKANFK